MYSYAVFYAQFGFFNGIPINQIDLDIDGSRAGTINAIYPAGPGNCFAQGTVPYQFRDANSISWNTTVFLANGGQIFGSGTLSPNNQECIIINVTR